MNLITKASLNLWLSYRLVFYIVRFVFYTMNALVFVVFESRVWNERSLFEPD